MSDRRHRERTLIENDAAGSPAPASAKWSDPAAVGAPPIRPRREPTDVLPGGTPAAPAAAPAITPVGGRRPREVTVVGEAQTIVTPSGPAASALSGAAAPFRSGPQVAVQPARRIAGWLLSGDRYTCHILRSGSNLVGRDPEQDILVDDPMVSGLQCNIICEVDETLLMPRPEARNPTSVNGKRIYMTQAIPPFATIQFAGTTFTFIPVPASGDVGE